MSDSPTLDQLIVVRPRFARSISLVRDASRPDALDGYILTPTGRDVLRRMAEALRGESTTRAWSLTGLYGSGKSAFALFATHLLGGKAPLHQKAKTLLASADAHLADSLFGPGSLPQSGTPCRLGQVAGRFEDVAFEERTESLLLRSQQPLVRVAMQIP